MSKTIKFILSIIICFTMILGTTVTASAFSRTVNKDYIQQNVDYLIDYIISDGYINKNGYYAIAEDYYDELEESNVIAYDSDNDELIFSYYAVDDGVMEIYVRMYLDSPKSSYARVEFSIYDLMEETFARATCTFDISTYNWEDVIYFIKTDSNCYIYDINDLASSWLYGALLCWNGTLYSKPQITLHAIGFVTLCKNTENGHEWVKSKTVKATTKSDGYVSYYCDICGETKKKTIHQISSVKLSNSKPTYTGKAIKPTVTVKDSKGKTISSSNYTVKYSNNTKVGTATVTVTFKGSKYSGKLTKTFKILPRASSISSLTAKSKGFTAKWSKQTSAGGYQLQYSTSSKFTTKTTKTVKITKNTTVSKTITKLTANKTYYVRVRTYKTVNDKTYYSAWSTSKKVKTKN